MELEYDPADPATIADPFPAFRRLRAEDPVHYNDALGGWVLTRFTDVEAALTDPRMSSDRISPFMDRLPDELRSRMDRTARALKSWAVFSDPPNHTRLRAFFKQAFTPQAAETMRGRIGAIIGELLGRLGDAEEFDLITDFAGPLPAHVVCELLGMPTDDIGRIRSWSSQLEPFLGLGRKPADSYESARQATEEMIDYFGRVVEDHRRTPRDDVLMQLIGARENGDRLSDDELIATCMMLQFAAHTTTTHLVGNGVLALLRNPGELQAVREDRSLVKATVDETLRYDGPIQALRRVAREPVELHGRRLDAGDLVFIMLNSANRDDQRFAEPDRFDIRRGDKQHIGFGVGSHFCAGGFLARIEGQIALAALLDRGTFERGDGEPQWGTSFSFRGLESLPVRIRRGE
jgi:cytochrome P450